MKIYKVDFFNITPNKNGCYINQIGDKGYYRNNKHHRIGGPAVECANGEKWWYLFGLPYSEDGYNKVMNNLPLLYWNFRHRLWK